MRFATYADLAESKCTIEEREEYEPYVAQNMIIYSGVDYERIVREAEKESDVIIWDGGNNEVSFYESDLLLILADPLRPGHETRYHPGECNCRMADAFILAKCHEAPAEAISGVEKTLHALQPSAECVRVASVTRLENEQDAAAIKGKTVVVVDDGPTLTHGGTKFGAGLVMARKLGLQVVDPRPHSVGSYRKLFQEFPHLEECIPAMGYTDQQIDDLAQTLNQSPADVVINGSPSDLKQLLGDKLKKPMYRVLYDVAPIGNGRGLDDLLEDFSKKQNL
jgi:predicted GTPase